MPPRPILTAAFILLAITRPVLADQFILKVVSISDGDTFTGLDSQNRQVKVRLHGIDAPRRPRRSAASPARLLVT